MHDDWVPARLRRPLQAVLDACRTDQAVLAAWVGGSLARETADDWSDVDLHLLVNDRDEFEARIVAWFSRAMPVVLSDPIRGVPGGFLFVSDTWIHVDVIVHDRRDFEQSELPARVLLDPGRLVRDVPASSEDMAGPPYFPRDQVTLFLYFMGVTVTVVHRQEWLALAQGAASFRDTLLIPLMLAENGIRKTDGAKRLNRYLTTEQIATLKTIPPVGSDPEDLIAAHTAIAREYLTRARRLADSLDEDWPAPLDDASRALWSQELGIHLD